MQLGRSSLGVIVWKSAVYVFGSCYGPATSKCERLKLACSQEKWAFIEDMAKARAYFTPVLWQEEVYLCGGYQNSTIEVCNGTNIRLIAVTLPEPGKALCCIAGETLLVLSSNYLTKVNTQGEVVAKLHPGCYFVPMTCPMLAAGCLYHSDNGKMQMFSAEDGRRRG